jgi:hypothetical protein
VLTGPQALLARLGVYVLIAVSLFSFGFLKGCQYESAERLELLAEQAKEGNRIAAARREVTIEVQKVYIEKAGKTEIVTEYVNTEVERYAPTNTSMCIDDNWIRLHDAAAEGKLPKGRSGVDDSLHSPVAAWENRRWEGLSHYYAEPRGTP